MWKSLSLQISAWYNKVIKKLFKNRKQIRQGELTDYRQYIFCKREIWIYSFSGITIVGFFVYFFYRDKWALIILWPIFIFYWRNKKAELTEKRKNRLKVQFGECILSVSTALKAGYSAENAFRQSLPDMIMMFDEDSLIVRELRAILKGLENHRNLEDLLDHLAERSGIEEIQEFSQVFRITKRNGGNMTQVLTETALMISQSLEIDRQIQLIISGKKLEQKIMNVVPFFILLYVSATSPGFFDVLYHNALGVIIMTCCLIAYLAAFWMAKRIVEIRI